MSDQDDLHADNCAIYAEPPGVCNCGAKYADGTLIADDSSRTLTSDDGIAIMFVAAVGETPAYIGWKAKANDGELYGRIDETTATELTNGMFDVMCEVARDELRVINERPDPLPDGVVPQPHHTETPAQPIRVGRFYRHMYGGDGVYECIVDNVCNGVFLDLARKEKCYFLWSNTTEVRRVETWEPVQQ